MPKKDGTPTKAELAKAAVESKKAAKAAKLAEKQAAKEAKAELKRAEKAVKESIAKTPAGAVPAVPVFPKFENAQVMETLSEIENGFILCKMSDGTKKHVPAELF